MPEFELTIDRAALDMLTLQEINETNGRHYYLLSLNPAVRVTVRSTALAELVGQTLAVIAGVEECWGQWQANAHLKGRRTYGVTIFAQDARDVAQETLSAWLRRNYLADGAAYGGAGGEYSTPLHPPKNGPSGGQ
jgi:hypothetical protein